MLDTFLTVAYQKTKKAEAQTRQVELLKKLPNDLLYKIASGQEKLGYLNDCVKAGGPYDGEEWLEKFQGSPLLAEAVAIRKQELELQMADTQQQRQRDEQYHALDEERQEREAARDDLSIKRKMLELQLIEGASGGGEEAAPAEPAVAMPPEAAAVPAAAPAPPVPAKPTAESPMEMPKPKQETPVKVASAEFEFALAKMKMASTQMKKEAIGLGSLGTVAKGIGSRIAGAAGAAGGVAKAMGGGRLSQLGAGLQEGAHAAWQNKGLAGKAIGSYAKANPMQAAGIGAGALAAGVGAKHLLSSPQPQQPAVVNNY